MNQKVARIFQIFCVLLVVMSSAFAKPKSKGAKAAVKGLHAEYTDWQGAAFGAEIPKWVAAVATASSEDEIRNLLDKPKGYRVWAIQSEGQNLDALKLLTDNFDIQAQVGASISQNVARIADRVQASEGATENAQITEQTAKIVDMVTTNLTLNGLERISSYWSKYFMANKKGKPVDGDSGKERYSYVVVMGMEGDRFNAQLDAAMAKIKENTSEDDYLRKLSDIVIADLKKPELLQAVITANVNIDGDAEAAVQD